MNLLNDIFCFFRSFFFIHCLRKGLPLDIDVYDAAEWSCLAELSERSAREGSRPVSIPDFTHGHWQDLQQHQMF